MAEAPWITIVGLGEDGPAGLSPASHEALARAEIIMGPPRHLALVPDTGADRVEWPVPFADGLEILQGFKGRNTVVLASGDPFWYGAGRAISKTFSPDEWRALPGQSVFSLVAAEMGWPLEDTLCLGLHAAPFTRLRRHLAPGLRAIILLRDGPAVSRLAEYLVSENVSAGQITVCEGMGGPDQRVSTVSVSEALHGPYSHPVCVALEVGDVARAISHASGLPDDVFDTDGVMTKRPIRALTMSALAPRPGLHLWDIGGGSGSVAVEWALSHRTCSATVVEARADRIALIQANADAFGLAQIDVVHGTALDVIDTLPAPDVVFVGGGLSQALLARLTSLKGIRLVANGVTLEAEALLASAHATHGGDLMRVEIAHAAPLGAKRGWSASYPVVQWSVAL